MPECPDSIEEFQELEKMLPLCRVMLYNQAKARIETGAAKSVSEAARQLADEMGRSAATIERAIYREQEQPGTLTLSELSGTDKHRPYASSEVKIPRVAMGEEEILKNAREIKSEKRKELSLTKQVELEVAQKTVNEKANVSFDSVCELRHCSCVELFKSIKPDAVITDPPYPKEYLSVFSELAQSCKENNIPIVAVMSGQTYLPEVFQRLCEHLEYRWTLAYLTPGGQSVQQWPCKVNTFWKPVLLFGEANAWIGDVCKSHENDNDKRFHGWGQSESGMADIVNRITLPGQLICDPFLGGGTTAVVSLALGRTFIGCDINEECVKTTRTRLKDIYA